MKNKKYIKLLRRSNYYLYVSLRDNKYINSLDFNLPIIITILKEIKEEVLNIINECFDEFNVTADVDTDTYIYGLCEIQKTLEDSERNLFLRELFYSILPHKYLHRQDFDDEDEINNFVLYSKRRFLFTEGDTQETFIESWYYYRLKWIDHVLKILKAEYKRKYDIQYELDF